MIPSWPQINSVLRIVLPFFLYFAVNKGWLTPEQSSALVEAFINALPYVFAFGAVVWGIITNRQAALVKKVDKAIAADPVVALQLKSLRDNHA